MWGICAYYVADSSVTRFARATSSTLEEELDKYKNVIPQNRLSILIGISKVGVNMSKSYVYIMTNNCSSTLYTGVTSNLQQRVMQHRNKAFGGFTSRYRLTRLVYVEELPTITSAISREKRIKMMSRERKMQLINKINPDWKNLL